MLVYFVSWTAEPELCKGKGRLNKNEYHFSFTVLCRNSSDAVKMLNWYFLNIFKNAHNLELSDGVFTMKRSVVDSRNFNIQWLFMDDIRYPLSFSDLKQSLVRYTNSFYTV